MIFYPIARAHLRARQMCAQPPVLEKMIENEIFEALIMARRPRRSARAPKQNQIRELQLKWMLFDYWVVIISPKLAEIANVEV